MEKELNIAAILKDKPKGLKLWSPAVGKCNLRSVDSYHEWVHIETGGVMNYWFNKKGFLFGKGERLIFPSKQMRDWSKFTWKKGDVLKGTDNCSILIFKEWANDDYTLFYVDFHYVDGTIYCNKAECCKTEHYTKASDREAKEFIKKIEQHYGGTLNLETLDIEQPKQEFKEGDIVVLDEIEDECYAKCILTLKNIQDNKLNYYAFFNIFNNEILLNGACFDKRTLRLATNLEKQQLFDALAKEGKVWNPDTLQVENLPKKCEFKPMGLCLMRDLGDRRWSLCQFGFYLSREESEDGVDYYPYCAVGGNWFHECIPYNKETKHLLGTTDEWKGGDV